MPGDEPRYLSRTGFPSYVDHPSRALQGEPEAVAEDVQQDLTDRATRTARERRDEVLQATLTRVRRAAEHHAAMARHAEREARRLERRLGL